MDFMVRLCPVLDRAAEEVAYRWGEELLMTRVYGKPPVGVVATFWVHPGLGPGGLQGMHWGSMAGGGGKVWADTEDQLAQRLSHEMWEWMVNPEGGRKAGPYSVEVADPVSVTPWVVQGPSPSFCGVPLSNFVYPSYFGYGTSGRYPYDQLGVLRVPGHPEPGAYQTVNGVLVQGPPLERHEHDVGCAFEATLTSCCSCGLTPALRKATP